MKKKNRNRLNRHREQTREVGWGREGLGVWDQEMKAIIYKMHKQQNPAV